MAENQEAASKIEDYPQPSFVKVVCKSSGKIRRFAAGTEAGFALNFINKKLESNGSLPLASHIEAVKKIEEAEEEEEEPIVFGPNVVLVNYGPAWILQTVVTQSQQGYGKGENVQKETKRGRSVKVTEDSDSAKTSRRLNVFYIGKILLAFIMIFVIGATFTLFLENLPTLLLYIHSNM